MTAKKGQKPKTMRELMPPRYLPILEERTGLERSAIWKAVNHENKNSSAWAHIVQLAKEYEQQKRDEDELLNPSSES